VSPPARPFAALAAIALVQGIALIAYGLFDVVESLRVGVTGPAAVSSVPAVILQIVIFAVFGAGLVLIAWGWWTVRGWARAPFLLAQLIGVFVGYELAQSAGAVERYVGIGLCLLGALGIVLVFTPSVMRSLQ
jgi:hypothetical protein